MLIGKTLRGFQLGLESVQGTAVAANRLIKNGTFKATRRNNAKKVDSEGHRNSLAQQRGKKWTEWTCTGALGYNVAAYWGHGFYDVVSPTNPGTGAYTYTYQDMNGTFHTPQTFTFDTGNSLGSNSRFAFGTMADYTITINSTSCDYSVSGFGAYPTKNITMTATPTQIAPDVVHLTDCRCSFSTTFAGLGAGKLTTPKELELSVKSKYKYQLFIDDATSSIGGILEKKPEMTGKITVAEGTESDKFLSALEGSTLFYLQLLCTGGLIIAGTPNIYRTIAYTWACFVDTEDETDDDDLFAGSYTFYGAEDTTNGDTNYVVTNTLSSL